MKEYSIIQKWDSEPDYCEIMQNKSVKFAAGFIPDDDPCTVWQWHREFRCRDFLTEVVLGDKFDRSMRIYGFWWRPQHQKLNKDKTVLLVYGKDLPFKMMQKKMEFLHYYEGYGGWTPTQIFPAVNSEGKPAILVIGPPEWKESPLYISLYTLLIRVMSYDDIVGKNPIEELKYFVDNSWTNDARYCRDILKAGVDIPKLVRYQDIILQNASPIGTEGEPGKWPRGIGVETMHDNGGIVSFAYALTNRAMLNTQYPQVQWVENYKGI